MKKTLHLLFCVFLVTPLFSQDRMITVNGDTINCTITKISGGFVYYNIKKGEEIQNKVLDKKLVRRFELDKAVKRDLDTLVKTYPSFLITFSGGLSRRIATIDPKASPALRAHYEELIKGINLNAAVFYYPTTIFGFGLKYSMFTSSDRSASPVTIITSNGTPVTGILSEEIYINYFAPAISLRSIHENNKMTTYGNFSVGYMGYTNNLIFIYPFIITGNTVGFSGDLGADFIIGKQWNAGLLLSLSTGVITKIDIDYYGLIPSQTINLKKEEYEGLLRGDISIGLRYTF